MAKIIDRTGKGSAINQSEFDANYDSLHGINQVIAGATHTVDITDQGDTLEFTNAGAVAVTLDDIATIQGAAHTSDFKVTLIATNAATVATITPDATDSINTGVATIVLTVDEYVTLQTDSTGAVWNIIGGSDATNLGGLASTQFIRSDANDTASGDLDLTGAVDLQGTWEIGSTTVTATAADLNLIDNSIAGTAVASKALVLGASKNIDTIDVTKDGLEIGGTAMTCTAAELNFNDTAIAGTAVASKTLVLGATKNIDTIDVAKDGLEIGGTAMTCTAAELNTLDGIASTTAELNITDGDTADSSVTVVDADQLIINDGGTMKQTAMTDIALYTKNENNAGLNTKIVDIGDWNMDTTASVNVAHGLTLSKIRVVSALIRDDLDALYRSIFNTNFSETSGSGITVDSTNIALGRPGGGIFDSVNYDSTSYNRGWITIQYTD